MDNNKFVIPLITLDDIISHLQTLNIHKSMGSDGIGARFLHDAGKNIAEVLLNIINTSLLEGVYPNEWKMAKVSPLFKSGNVSDINNYRPISVLNCFSKIIEKHVHKHFYEYLNQNEVLSSVQSGFLSNLSDFFN